MTVERAVPREAVLREGPRDARTRSSLLSGPSVRRVVQALGTSLLALRAGAAGLDREVTDVQILAPGDPPEVDAGALVLAVGSTRDEELRELVQALLARSCAGVVVRSDDALPGSLTAAEEGGLPFLALGPEASWTRVAEVVTGALSGARDDGGDAAGLPWGDLFSLANAISALLDSPVTIEDPLSRVLAFSGRQDEADEGRVQTILGRRVPPHWLRMLEERGVFRALRSSRAPVFVEALSESTKPRVAIGIFAGDEPLGSIWAVTGSLTPERAQALTESAQIAALHLLRLRVSSDVGRRLQSDLVAGMLEGGARAEAAGARLFPQAGGLRVLAVAPISGDPEVADAADAAGERSLQHLRDAVAMHFSSGTPRAAAAVLGGVVYVVVPADRDDPAVDTTARTLAAGLSHTWDVGIAIGPRVAAHRDLPSSRAEADHVLRVLRAEAPRSTRRVARSADVRVSSLLLAIADLDEAGERLAAGPVEQLERYDVENRTELLTTLEVFLECWGSVQQAAARLHIHQNTLRYRIARAGEIGGIDLTDPDERLAVTLALRLRRFRADTGGER